MKNKYNPKIEILKKGEPLTEVKFECPVCGNEICLMINTKTDEIVEIYSDASEGDEPYQIKCGSCQSILKWTPKPPKNPSRRK